MGVGDAPTDLLAQGLPRIDDRVVIAAVDLVGQTVRPSEVERAPHRQLVAVLVEDVDLAHHKADCMAVDHARSIQVPAATSSAPLTRALWAPNGPTFSNATKAVSAKMTARFITPPANSSSISAQQQPRQ